MLQKETIDAIRSLSIDMTNQANSGHPGMPLGSAPLGYTLFKEMKINPKKPTWFDRDRFVLASGHASALLYSLLHLSGYNLTIDDLKHFRQLNSLTPGHPEAFLTPGVDATTGPLGQGVAMALGMALSEKVLAQKYNKADITVVDHYTYVLCGDGDMQEGVTSEASQLAAHWGLGKLIVFYDSNDVTLDGELSQTSSESVKLRYEAYGWQYILVDDGNDVEQIAQALEAAQLNLERPTLIEVKTIIGYGSAKQGTNAVHGAPLGVDDGLNAKKKYGCSTKEFDVPNSVYDSFTYDKLVNGAKAYKTWQQQLKTYKTAYPKEYAELQDVINNDFKVDFSGYDFKDVGFKQATRNSNKEAINYIANKLPTFMGGSADLSHSVMSNIDDSELFSKDNIAGRNINYGIREFAMGAINNGVLLHGGIKIFGGTFLVFADYMKPAVKLAALMQIPTIFVYTHDSIAIGEDGPTHEPIEQLAMFRAMPNVNVIRASDANEAAAGWSIAINSTKTPTVLVFSRQDLVVHENSNLDNVRKGAYIAYHENKTIDALLIATGSEVNLAIAAAKKLKGEKIDVRVVSMPSRELFEQQTKKYINEIIPPKVKKRLVIEMASSFGWQKYALKDNQIMAIDTYGLSAPGDQVVDAFGFTVANVVARIKKIVK
jgi:transketolase